MDYRHSASVSRTNLRNSSLSIRVVFWAFASILITFSGCKSKKQVTSDISDVKRDSIYVEKTVIKRVPVEVIVEKQAECDSLGILKDFEETLASGGNTIVVRSSGGVITTTATYAGSISEMIEKNRESSRFRLETIKIPYEVNKPYKSKWFWISIGLNLLFLAYIFRRFIPFLRFIP